MKTGIANLPLHYGQAPPWLFDRMGKLARSIIIGIVSEFGQEEFLKRLADPYWFQSLGCVLGFDWHSSGLTTTVCAALKEGIKGIEKDLGLFIVGGKGKTSRKAPEEIKVIAQKRWIKSDGQKLIYASRLSAKVDNSAIDDGFQIYHHTFIFTKEGKWAVVQQGMNTKTAWARRYHWFSQEVSDFVCEPHSAICGMSKLRPLNMIARESADSRKASTYLTCQNPTLMIKKIKRLTRLNLPAEHNFSLSDINPSWLEKILLQTYLKKPKNFEELLGLKNVGPKTIRSLALIAQLIYGTKPSFRDPMSFSFAHGGKDGVPYPVDKKVYDSSIEIMAQAIKKTKIGLSVKNEALKKLIKFYK